MVANSRLDRLRRIRNHSLVLAGHSSACDILALSLPLAVSISVAHVDGNVDRLRVDYLALAAFSDLSNCVELDSRGDRFCNRPVDL